MASKTPPTKPKKLSVKQSKFVAEVIKTGNKTAAYRKVYQPKTKNMNSIYRQANEVSRNNLVRQAIDAALELHELTPEYAVRKLKEVIDQDKEIGAKRLAIKDALELNGWQRGDRPSISVVAQNAAFFSNTRQLEQD